MSELAKTEVLKMKTMLISLLDDGNNELALEILRKSEFSIVSVHFDNWGTGIWYYQAELSIELKIFKNLTPGVISSIKSIIYENLSKIFDNQYQCLDTINIIPLIEYYVDWKSIAGKTSKEELINKIRREMEILELSSTGGHIRDFKDEYMNIHEFNKETLKILNIPHPLIFTNIDNWITYIKQQGDLLSSYASRRTFIKKTFEELLNILSDSDEDENIKFDFTPTGWEKIDDSVMSLQKQLREINDRIDLNQIGVRCRETIIMVAQEVYIDSIHKPSDYKDEISNSDSSRMIQGFLEYELEGGSNKEKRTYAKNINNLANKLVHSSTVTLIDAQLTLSATISLITIIKILDKHVKEN